MNIRRMLGFMVLVGVTAVAISGCFVGMTIPQRLEAFVEDLSLGAQAARADTYLNFYEGKTQDYAAIAGPVSGDDYIWDTYFPQTPNPGAYTIADINDADPSAVLAQISGPAGNGVPWPLNARFVMDLDGFNYLIVELWLDVGKDGFDPADQIIN